VTAFHWICVAAVFCYLVFKAVDCETCAQWETQAKRGWHAGGYSTSGNVIYLNGPYEERVCVQRKP
jgi:hypothetical protein